VLKTGRLVGSRRVEETTQDEILRMIVSGVSENGGALARRQRESQRFNNRSGRLSG